MCGSGGPHYSRSGDRRYNRAGARRYLSPQRELGNRCQLHKRSSLVDLADFGVAVELLDGVVAHKTRTAKDLDRQARHAFGGMRSKVLAHRRFLAELPA